MNTQAITNLLFGEFYLPPQSYEFIRLIASTTYPEIPSWNKRTYHYIFPHNYSLSPISTSTFGLVQDKIEKFKPERIIFY
jgi:hypothetical protein